MCRQPVVFGMPLFDFDEDSDEDLDGQERLEALERRLRRVEHALASANFDGSLEDVVESMPDFERDAQIGVSAGSSYRLTIPRELGDSYELTGTDKVAIRDLSNRVGEKAFVVKVLD